MAEIDSKGWSGVMAAKEEKVATMKEEIVSKNRKVKELVLVFAQIYANT